MKKSVKETFRLGAVCVHVLGPAHHFRHVVQRSPLLLVKLALDSGDSLQLLLSITVA